MAKVVCALLSIALTAGVASDRGRAARRPLSQIAQDLARLARSDQLSGTVLIAKNGKPILTRAYGAAHLRPRVPNRVDTRFNLASLGKTFTGVAIAQLVQQAKLRFTDKVGLYLHGFPRDIGDSVTIAQLLDHSSGLGDFFQHAGYLHLQPRLTTLAAYLPLIVDEPPVFEPGTRFRYSNSGYILLGLVVESVSGKSYYDYLTSHVFGPAGMTRSGCFWKRSLPPGTATGYTGTRLAANTATLPPRGTSAGGCYSTAGDLLRFANALFAHRLLSAALTRTITTPKIASYGYGFGVRGRPPTVWHNGGSPGVGTELDVNRRLGYTVVLLTNRDPPEVPQVMDLILNALGIP